MGRIKAAPALLLVLLATFPYSLSLAEEGGDEDAAPSSAAYDDPCVSQDAWQAALANAGASTSGTPQACLPGQRPHPSIRKVEASAFANATARIREMQDIAPQQKFADALAAAPLANTDLLLTATLNGSLRGALRMSRAGNDWRIENVVAMPNVGAATELVVAALAHARRTLPDRPVQLASNPYAADFWQAAGFAPATGNSAGDAMVLAPDTALFEGRHLTELGRGSSHKKAFAMLGDPGRVFVAIPEPEAKALDRELKLYDLLEHANVRIPRIERPPQPVRFPDGIHVGVAMERLYGSEYKQNLTWTWVRKQVANWPDAGRADKLEAMKRTVARFLNSRAYVDDLQAFILDETGEMVVFDPNSVSLNQDTNYGELKNMLEKLEKLTGSQSPK